MSRTAVAFDFWYQPVFQNPDGSLFCDGCTGPTIAPSIWDKVFFASVPTPGVAEVDAKRERKVDEKDAPGSDGATVTIHGVKPADITIKLLIWTPDQKKAMDELLPLIMTPPYKTVTTSKTLHPIGPTSVTTVNAFAGQAHINTIPKAPTTITTKSKVAVTFDVSHPKFKGMGIKAVQIVGLWGPDMAPVPGARVWTIKAIEYLPKGKTVATTTDVKPLGSLYDPQPYASPDQNSNNLAPR